MPRVVRLVAPREIELGQEPSAPVGPGEVRVRTAYSGISAGTELTTYRGSNPFLHARFDPATRLFGGPPEAAVFPTAGWGYSEVGTVVEVGPGVAAPVVGEAVWGIWGHREEAVLPAAPLAGHVLAPRDDLLPGVFARVGAIAFNAVQSARAGLGDCVAVFGQGVIGLLATRLATAAGADVVAVDGLAGRRVMATTMGAREVADPAADPGPAQLVRALTDGRGADAAIELSGSYRALHEAIRSVGVEGRVAAAGFYQGDASGLRLGEEFHHNRVQVVASQIGGVDPSLAGRWTAERLQRTFMTLVAHGRVDPRPLVSHTIAAEKVADAFELLDQHPAECLQVVLDFTGAGS
jgi:2-desacetyl-2-hydroxyethyl bacteriochlorophyllide A dehydrogenase